jgi:hypothetical protein
MNYHNIMMNYQKDSQGLVGITSVTPDMARLWLANEATFQRSVSKDTVRKYAELIRKGEFKTTPSQAIAIDNQGRVIDGQHRLLAVIEANMSVNMAIHHNADPDLFSVIDRGRPRTLQQIAEMGGTNCSEGYCVSAVGTLLWKHTSVYTGEQTWDSTEIVEVLKYYEPQLRVVFPKDYSGSKQIRNSPFRGAILRALISRPEEEEKITHFIRLMASGIPEKKEIYNTRMPLMLSKYARDYKGKNDRTTRWRQWMVSLNALKHFLADTEVKLESNFRNSYNNETQPFPIALDDKPHYMSFHHWLEVCQKTANK